MLTLSYKPDAADRFRVRRPKQSPAASVPRSQQVAPLPAAQDAAHTLRQVLVADDDEQILAAAAMRLQSAGYETIVTKDGAGVAAFVAMHHPQAIVLDVRMPQCDGLQVLAILRASRTTKRIPVVMLSASLADRQRALQAGARFFLDKPYLGSNLVEAVNQAIAESLDQKESLISYAAK